MPKMLLKSATAKNYKEQESTLNGLKVLVDTKAENEENDEIPAQSNATNVEKKVILQEIAVEKAEEAAAEEEAEVEDTEADREVPEDRVREVDRDRDQDPQEDQDDRDQDPQRNQQHPPPPPQDEIEVPVEVQIKRREEAQAHLIKDRHPPKEHLDPSREKEMEAQKNESDQLPLKKLKMEIINVNEEQCGVHSLIVILLISQFANL